MKDTSDLVIQKEMYIPDIGLHLEQLATTHRVRVLVRNSDHAAELRRHGEQLFVGIPGEGNNLDRHPFRLLYEGAQDLIDQVKRSHETARGEKLASKEWSRLSRATQIDKVKTLVQPWVDQRISDLWDDYMSRGVNQVDAQQYGKPLSPAMREGWGEESLRLYREVDIRGQSTMLLQLRTECIGLDGYLHSIGKAPWPECSCGSGRNQTARHLLMECRDLQQQRKLFEAKFLPSHRRWNYED